MKTVKAELTRPDGTTLKLEGSKEDVERILQALTPAPVQFVPYPVPYVPYYPGGYPWWTLTTTSSTIPTGNVGVVGSAFSIGDDYSSSDLNALYLTTGG